MGFRTSLVALLLALAWAASSFTPISARVTSLFIFGDEYVDTGSARYRRDESYDCAVSPYGVNLPPGETVGRCSNALLFVDEIAKSLALQTPGPWFGPAQGKRNGINFAFVGAGMLPVTNGNNTVGFYAQRRMFRQYLRQNPGIVLNESLFVISFGTNDYVQALERGRDPVAVTDLIMPILTRFITEVKVRTQAYRFLIVTPPPIGCLPLVRQKYGAGPDSCIVNLHALNDNHDSRLDSNMDRLLAVQPRTKPLYFSRFSMSKLFLDPRNGFARFSKPLENACGVVDSVTRRRIHCGEAFLYRDPNTGQNVTYRVGAPRVTNKSYWWWDWLNPTSFANKAMWVSLWMRKDTSYPDNTRWLSLR